MKKIILVVIVILILPLVIMAETLKLDINKAVNMGMKNSKIIKVYQKAYEISKKDEKINRSSMFPEISINSTYVKTDKKEEQSITIPNINKTIKISPEMDSQNKNSIEIKQPLFTGFTLYNRTKIYSQKSSIEKSKLVEKKREVEYDIRKVYWRIYKLNNIEEVLYKTKSQLNSHLENVNNFLDEGMATRADILDIKEKLSEIGLKIMENQNKIEKLKNKLKNILGIDRVKKVTLISEIPDKIKIKYKRKECIEKALKNKELIKQIKINRKVQSLKNKIAKGSLSPKLSLIGKYHYDKPNNSIQPLKNEYNDSWEAGISFKLDIFKGKERFHEIAKTELKKEKAEIYLSHVTNKIKDQIINYFLDYKKNKSKLCVLKKNLNSSKENYRISKNMYQEGMIKSSDLLDKETSLMESKINRLNGLIDLKLSELKLKKAMGVL